MNKTKIPYLTHTWNPIAMRCTPVSDGCANCWHLKMTKRLAGMSWPDNRAMGYSGNNTLLNIKELNAPLRTRKSARIGVQFMGDLFHESVPKKFILKILNVIEQSKNHSFLVLTKRPARMKEIAGFWNEGITTPNMWLGVSVEDQKTADERIRLLCETPAGVKFISYEPVLGQIDIKRWLRPLELEGHQGGHGVNWVIMGGESGPGARPMHPNWARSVRDQCQAEGVPFFFKQWGEWAPSPVGFAGKNLKFDNFGEQGLKNIVFKVGAKLAGRMLDGEEYSELPGE